MGRRAGWSVATSAELRQTLSAVRRGEVLGCATSEHCLLEIRKKLQAQEAELVVTGSGDIKVTDEGFVHTAEVNVVGSGEIDLRVVRSEVIEANIVGSGDIELGEVLQSIQGAILGSGDVRFDGDPEVDGELRAAVLAART